ncbi:hypothetical protein BGZ88_008987 [Linnemannia elongata]|nr:hypothetical protein BGZ88_008987 [Linnemannia elongata]
MKFTIASILSTAAAALTIFSLVQAAVVPTPVEIQKRAIEGINNYACKLTPAHPRPLLLVHGTTLTLDSWSTWAPLLVKEGYCVFGLTYGKYKDVPLLGGIAPIQNNSQEVANFANNVLARMNATQLDYIGHSQGGILGRYWIKYLDGAGKINRMIGVSPIHHGTTLSGITTFASALHLLNPVQSLLDAVAPALYQMIVGSPFMQKLNAGGDTSPGVIHSNIATRYDEIVTPWETCYQDAPGVTNTLLQDLCLLALNEHISIIDSKIALRWALNQLDPSTAKTANCLSFQREINILGAAGKHDSLVKYFGLVNDPSGEFPLLELCRPLDLFGLLCSRDRLTYPEVRYFGLGITAGLAHLHDKGIVHRDLKPENFFISFDMQVRVGDLGLAARYDSRGMSQGRLGTKYFMAPEVVKGEPHTYAMGIFSFGCIMYMMLLTFQPYITTL